MNDDELIEDVRSRAFVPATRTDSSGISGSTVAPCATVSELEGAEQRLRIRFHVIHRRLLLEVGNGGFGPGYGILGLPGGHTDDDGRSLLELREVLSDAIEQSGLPHGILPLCEWGCGVWSCIDELSEDGRILTLDHRGLTDTEVGSRQWFEGWAAGKSLWEDMFFFEEKEGINPFTKAPTVLRVTTRPKGVPYRRVNERA